MSEVGRRVKLVTTYHDHLVVGTEGVVTGDDHPRYLWVQWHGFTRPMAHRPEEVEAV